MKRLLLVLLVAAPATAHAQLSVSAGVRLRLPGFAPFAEGRGVLVFGDGNKFTYLTLAAGLLF